MKRNIVEITRKNKIIKTTYFDSMWTTIYMYNNWKLTNIRRAPDQEEYHFIKY